MKLSWNYYSQYMNHGLFQTTTTLSQLYRPHCQGKTLTARFSGGHPHDIQIGSNLTSFAALGRCFKAAVDLRNPVGKCKASHSSTAHSLAWGHGNATQLACNCKEVELGLQYFTVRDWPECRKHSFSILANQRVRS